jgi:hypothetical protein
MSQIAFLTRRQLIVFLTDNGFPIGKGTIDRLCSPAIGAGPPVAHWFGNRALYDPAAALEWARSRLRSQQRIAPKATDLAQVGEGA